MHSPDLFVRDVVAVSFVAADFGKTMTVELSRALTRQHGRDARTRRVIRSSKGSFVIRNSKGNYYSLFEWGPGQNDRQRRCNNVSWRARRPVAKTCPRNGCTGFSLPSARLVCTRTTECRNTRYRKAHETVLLFV